MVFILLLVVGALADQKFPFKPFEKLDKNNDGKLTKDQFLEGCLVAVRKSGVEQNQRLITDIAKDFLSEKKTKKTILLSDIRDWMDSDKFLKYFRKWRQRMYRELLELTGFGKDQKWKGASKQEVLKNPEIYGLSYSNYLQIKSAKKEQREDL